MSATGESWRKYSRRRQRGDQGSEQVRRRAAIQLTIGMEEVDKEGFGVSCVHDVGDESDGAVRRDSAIGEAGDRIDNPM